MTLIVTYINKFGIVHLSDSNLTDENDENAGEAQKTFSINYLSAGLTLAGIYSVNGVRMDDWMNAFINNQAQIPNITLRQFAENLRALLENNMLPEEKESGSLIHIMGYVEENGRSHPEFWFVRNVHHLNLQTGAYENVNEQFAISEDFWGRDCPADNIMGLFRQENLYAFRMYINGFTSGRIAYNIVQQQLDRFFIDIWRKQEGGFRPPQSIEETELLAKLYMQVINTLFLLSNNPGQAIGGTTQTNLIPQPINIVDHC